MNLEATTRDTLVPLVQELIRNRCVNDGTPESGNELASARTLKEFFLRYGLEGEILALRPSRANFVLRRPGTDPAAPSLAFMGHTDVVPADPVDWTVDPFAGELRDGYLWGRGALDMLNITAGSAVAFAELAKNGKQYPGDLVYLALADEEASGRLGARWITENHWDAVKADYLVTEVGGFRVSTDSGPAVAVAVGEKGLAWAKVSVKGTAGHASMPYRADNAAVKIAEVIRRLTLRRSTPQMTSTYRRMAASLGRGAITRWLLQHPAVVDWGLARTYRRSPGIAKFLDAGCRMSLSPGILRAGTKTNIIPDNGSVELDIRILPDQSVETVQAELLKRLGDLAGEVDIQFSEFYPSNVSDERTPLMRGIEQLVAEANDGAPVSPIYLGGVTDGRYWRQRGTVVYGATLFDESMTIEEFASLVHGTDERVSVGSLEQTLNFFYRLPDAVYRGS